MFLGWESDVYLDCILGSENHQLDQTVVECSDAFRRPVEDGFWARFLEEPDSRDVSTLAREFSMASWNNFNRS